MDIRDIVAKLADGGPVRMSGGSWSLRCPAHDDGKASLSVSPGREHPIVLHCHAGCTPDAIADARGLVWADLCKPRAEGDRPAEDEVWTPAGPAVAVYDYRDENGELLFQVCRTASKDFRQRRPDPTHKSGWAWQLGDTRRVIYRLPRVIQAVQECREIYICEGEKDVHTLEGIGLVATCNPGGAGNGKWKPEYSEVLRDAVVVIVADNDPPGQAHARQIREALTGIAAEITVKEAASGKDATDHFNAGHTLDDLLTVWPRPEPKPLLAADLWEFLDAADTEPDWLIPGLMERGDRLILTGFEGQGKSMLVRQIAVCAAAGIHPFRHDRRFPPIRVLMIDCENSEAQSRRKFRPIAESTRYLQQPVPKGGMYPIIRPAGIDLTNAEDAEWLLERVTAHRPDLLIVGPFYRLYEANMNDELVARRVVAVLDKARALTNSAFITEAHAGHGDQHKGRSVRPTGSSLLLRWPEFGYGLSPNELAEPDEYGRCREMDFTSWRGARDERDWPQHLRYGRTGEMPWQQYKPAAMPKPDKPKGAKR